jgi:hypothetical protein
VSTAGRSPLLAFARRRAPRCPLAVPVRVTVLRSGTAYSIPGRSVDLGEGGIAVVLAGEVRLTDSVGVEFLLPDLGLGLQAKAVVRHHSPLRCGLEFKGLTRHQQAVIREWARQRLQSKAEETQTAGPEPAIRPSSPSPGAPATPDPAALLVRRILWLAAGALALAGLLIWWHWQRGWRDIEQQIPQTVGQVTGNADAPTYVLASAIARPAEL